MKSHIRLGLVFAVSLLTVCTMIVCFSACREVPTVMIDPVDTPTSATSATYVTRPTVAVPEGQLILTDLMQIHGPEMYWSDLEGYTYTEQEDGSLRFTVADTYGKECWLDVTVDYDSGLLTKADLFFEDTHADIMVEASTCFMPVLYAMNGKTPAQ